jgi:hypothetical protein
VLVSVQGADGIGAPLRVELASLASAADVVWTSYLDETKRAEIAGLEPGEYSCRVLFESGQARMLACEPESVALAPGKNNVQLRVREL